MALTYTPEHIFMSKRLVYRAFEDNEEDKAFLKQQILNDHTIQVMSTDRLPRPSHSQSTEAFVKMFHDSMLGVLICLQPEGHPKDDSEYPSNDEVARAKPIGHVGLFNHLGPDTSHHRNVMLGISLAPGFRGKGYGGEAINWGLDWAFRYAGAHRVGLAAFSYNENAVKLYRKLGFVQDGREREAIYHLRAWHDVILFSMLEHEWETLRGVEKN
ncbi:hypothetical protein PENANT_c022G03020 [Penicillium antarcticum]|uniref:N-acetyltransferase domain-containing protein n=1 Tax=Penicillium antarcticum TaxID=416450 RepID=A0A1V6PZ95_9EURO|nr:uncharacterized protein N7508_002889 [Penicillium antarcticum]KAJ5312059.1 hypothetical protein N7508_002889 [Penicillium antarcticum]OQD82271.1 hypothetical protein PENANT_c022G03020 [Penicillium antarcticum]